METIIYNINLASKKFTFLELSIFSLKDEVLIIAASEDFSYYHNFEIHFKNVFTVIGNIEWRADTKKEIIEIIDNTSVAVELNKKYKIEQGNKIFGLISEDGFYNYIVAEEIIFKNEIVRYH